jgi:hypothetical protein
LLPRLFSIWNKSIAQDQIPVKRRREDQEREFSPHELITPTYNSVLSLEVHLLHSEILSWENEFILSRGTN